jgi:acyl-CoA oxidase
LLVNQKDHGVKSFVVPLRDPKTFCLLHGINIGDCGSKMGRNGIDNGWVQFTHVRIPRSYMLMKYTKISRDGQVTEPPIPQMAYGALIYGRVSMIKESGDAMKKALTIAIRYSIVRKQFSSGPNLPESKILDYKTHHHRLFPSLAAAYAIRFAVMEVNRIYDVLMTKIERADAGNPSMKEAIEALKEMHATSAGLKAYST